MWTLCTGGLSFSLSRNDNIYAEQMRTFWMKYLFYSYQNIVRLPSMVEGLQDTNLQRTVWINGTTVFCFLWRICLIFHRRINSLCHKYSVLKVLILRRISPAPLLSLKLLLLSIFMLSYSSLEMIQVLPEGTWKLLLGK